MAEQNVDNLLDDFDGVEDIDCDIDDLDKALSQTEQVNTEQVVNETVEPEVKVEPTEKNLNDLSIEELKSLLPKNTSETTATAEPTEQKVGGDLNIALHQAREDKRLLKQEMDLLRQQMELLKVNSNTQPNEQSVQVNKSQEDILADLDDNDALTKADVIKLLKVKDEQAQASQAQTIKQQNNARTLELEKQFNESHGSDLGIMSYVNVVNLQNTGKVILTDSQKFGINNAINEGKNPAEVLYNSIIDSVPVLQKEKFKSKITQMIKEKSKGNAQPVKEEQSVGSDDFTGMSKESTDLDSHLDKLSDF